MKQYKTKSGFTLLEILLAIFIFSVVTITIFGSYNSIFSSVGYFEKDLKDYEMAKNCLHRMIKDLKSIRVSLPPEYKPPDINDEPDPYRFVSKASSEAHADFPMLRFSSLAHTPFENGTNTGISEIIYYVTSNDNINVLRRVDNVYPYLEFDDSINHPVMCEGLKSLKFKLFDQEGEEYDFWNSDSDEFSYATPSSISIILEIGDDSGSLVLETMVKISMTRLKMG